MRLALVLSLVVMLLSAACSGDGSTSHDTAETGPDVIVADAAPDVAEDVSVDVYVPPDPAFTFEPEGRTQCVADEASIQDYAEQYRTVDRLPVLDATAVLPLEEEVWVGTSAGVFRKAHDASAFVALPLATPEPSVDDLVYSDGFILVVTGEKVYRVSYAGEASELPAAPGPIHSVVSCAEVVYLLSEGAVSRLDDDAWTPIDVLDGSEVDAIGCNGRALLSAAGGVWQGDTADLTALPGPALEGPILAFAYGGTVVYAVTATQVVRYPLSGAETTVWGAGPGAIPAEDNTALAITYGGDRWAVGHAIGVSTYEQGAPRFEHFQSLRYLPDDEVRDLAFDDDGSLWVATAGGVARLYREWRTLEQKADDMLAELDAWHWRLGGIASVRASFDSPWSTDNPVPLDDDDNDGQWTQEALGALCYAYAATGDERYYERARRAVEAMMMLIDVPASDFEAAGLGRGFVTRSVVRDDEGDVFTSKATQSNWHLVHYVDGHDYYWKDDTSSDETTGHFYGFPLYYDLCAQDDEERAEVAGYIVDLASTILENNYQLIDLDGEVTTHAFWNPERLAAALDGVQACLATNTIDVCSHAWGGGGFLNSVQILGAMLAAWHVSGEQRFYDAYESLITEHRYDELATFNPETTMTWIEPAQRNLCDHELADLAFLTLLRYDPNPSRREQWAQSLLAAWEYEREERNPLKVLSMVAARAETEGLEEARRTLREYPLDLRHFFFDLSHRKDYVYESIDRHGEAQYGQVPPYDEIRTVRWDSNPYAIAHGRESGQTRTAPTFWLLPYWGLRYYGAICE